RTVQLTHAFDYNPVRPRAFDLCSHFVKEICEILNLGFASCSFDDGHAVGQHGCHHYVVCAEHSRTECAVHADLCCAQFGRENFNVAALHAHGGAERFESFQMQINRPVANYATTRQSDGRFLAPTQQWSKNTYRRAHFSNNVVCRNRIDLFRDDTHVAAGAFHLRAEVHQDLQHVMRV